MSDAEHNIARTWQAELEYLLSPAQGAASSPHPESEGADGEHTRGEAETRLLVARRVAARCALLRRAKGISQRSLAASIDVQPGKIIALERGRITQGSTELETFILYAQELGVPLRALLDEDWFQHARQDLEAKRLSDNPGPTEPVRSASGEAALLGRISDAVQTLRAKGEALTPTSVSREVGLRWATLTRYASRRQFLQGLMPPPPRNIPRRAGELEAEMLDRIPVIVRELRAGGHHVTIAEIAEQLQVTTGAISYYPRVRSLLEKESVKIRRGHPRKHEKAESGALQTPDLVPTTLGEERPDTSVIDHLAEGEISLDNEYPKVISQPHEVARAPWKSTPEERRQKDAILCQRLEEARKALELRGEHVSQSALSREVHVSPSGLRLYPGSKAFLEEVIAINRRQHSRSGGRYSRVGI